MGIDKSISQTPAVKNILLQADYPTSYCPPAIPTTAQSVAARPVNSFTSASSVGLTTATKTVPLVLNIPIPWTRIQLLILECKLCYYLNKAFVKKLTYDLCHGCTISYTGS